MRGRANPPPASARGGPPGAGDLRVALAEANVLHQRGQYERAEALYRAILKRQPRHFDALHLLGVIAAQRGQARKAAELLADAIKVDPGQAAAHCNRGNVLQQLNQATAALESFDRAVALKPDYAVAWYNRGHVLAALTRWDAALSSYERAIALQPMIAEWHFHRGVALQTLERDAAALAAYERALALRADYAEALCNRANLLKVLGRFDEAQSGYDRALCLNPALVQAHFNRGSLHQLLGRSAAALADYERALALRPDFAEAHLNRGLQLKELGRDAEALASYDRAIAARPGFPSAHLNRATLLLAAGNLSRGFREYECRWKSPPGPNVPERRTIDAPQWSGRESLAGKTVLLHAEQGLGDTLQFCRYAKPVAALGATVLLEVQAPLVALLASLPGVAQVFARGSPLPPVDYHCPLMSLPLACQTSLETIPPPAALCCPEPLLERWRGRFADQTRPQIGLAWSGNAGHVNDRRRSIPLTLLVEHLPSGAAYVCLQTDVRETDRPALLASEARIADVSGELHDFNDTAALCHGLDLVISVDSSPAHLAATLGRPTWILLPHTPDWRWLRDRSDSPWYPSVRLYRQERPGDWTPVIQRVAADLARQFLQDLS